MFTVEKLREKIQEENKRWEELSKQLEQQFTMQQGAHLGRVKLLEEQLEELVKEEQTETKT